jgi:PAS domain S-box-containing protein
MGGEECNMIGTTGNLKALSKYAEGLALVVENLPHALIIADKNLNIQYFNAHTPKVFGYSSEEFSQNTVNELIAPHDRPRVKKEISVLFKDKKGMNGRNKILDIVVLKHDAKKSPAKLLISQVPQKDCQFDVFLSFGLEPACIIKPLEIDLCLKRKALSTDIINALDMLEDPVIVFDKNWCYQFVNKTAWEQLEGDKSEVLGMNVWKMSPQMVGTNYHTAAYESMQEQKKVEIEEYYPHIKQWYKTIFYPSENSLVAQMQNITELANAKDLNNQMMGTLEDAMEVYWSDKYREHRQNKKS